MLDIMKNRERQTRRLEGRCYEKYMGWYIIKNINLHIGRMVSKKDFIKVKEKNYEDRDWKKIDENKKRRKKICYMENGLKGLKKSSKKILWNLDWIIPSVKMIQIIIYAL